MSKNNLLSSDVDLDKLAERTKNYTGAEIESVCRSANSYALFGYDAVVKLLLSHGDIKVSKANKKGETPFYMAIQYRDTLMATKNRHNKVVDLLRKKLREPLNEDTTCVVCLESRPEVVLLPCGHKNLCGPCAWQCYDTQQKCPLDRIKISEPLSLETDTDTEPEKSISSTLWSFVITWTSWLLGR